MTNRCSFDYTDTAVLVTGGTRGIGHAIATAFADAGALVTITGTRAAASDYDDVSLERFTYLQLDTRDPEAVDRIAAGLASLDVLVNNAGVTFPDGRDEWDPEGFSLALAVNLEGAMRLSARSRRLLAASEMAGGASIVNVVSCTAFRATTLVPGYSAAKAALVSLTRNMAATWVDDGIRVNAIAPGLIHTRMMEPALAIPEILEPELKHAVMQRMGTTAEVGPAVLFLACEASSFITGTVLAIDGGYLAT